MINKTLLNKFKKDLKSNRLDELGCLLELENLNNIEKIIVKNSKRFPWSEAKNNYNMTQLQSIQIINKMYVLEFQLETSPDDPDVNDLPVYAVFKVKETVIFNDKLKNL